MEEPGGATVAKKPYLRRGSGWEARVTAAREGRRYQPKGGTVVNFVGGETAAGRSPARAPAKRKSATPAARPAAQPAASRGTLRKQAAAARSGTVPAPAQQPPRREGTSKAQPAPAAARAPVAQRLQQPAADLVGVSVRLGGGGGAWGVKEETEEDLELKEFCALESEVLREVSNCAPAPASAVSPGKPAPSPRPAHSGAAIRGSVAHSWQPQQQDRGRELQHGTEDEGEEVEDAFQSDDEGAVCSIFGRGPQQLPPPQGSRAAGRPAVSFAAQPAVVVEEEEEAELFAQSELINELPAKPTSSLVQKFFYSQRQEKPVPPPPEARPAEDLLQKQVEELEAQVKKLGEERAKVAAQWRQVEDARARLEQDRAALEKRKAEELAQVEALRAEEQRKLQRDRRVLEKQSRALLKLPTKREKEEIQALEAVLEKERQDARGKDARHKLTVDRLRRQVLELQERNRELQEQVQYLESQRLEHWGSEPEGGVSPAEGTKPGRSSTSRLAAALPALQGAANSVQPAPGGRRWDPPQASSSSHGRAACDAAAAEADAAAHDTGTMEHSDSEFEDSGHVVAEELDEGAILLPSLPAVRVSAHRQSASAQQLMPQLPGGEPPSGPAAAQCPIDEQHAASQGWAPTTAPALPANHAAGGQGQEAAADVMSKASSALSRFNQLRQSLLQHGNLQEKLSSRLNSLESSLQATPTAAPALAPAAAAPAAVMEGVSSVTPLSAPAATAPASTAQDDLRRLGRMLAAGSAAPTAAQPHPEAASSTHQPQRVAAAPIPATAPAGASATPPPPQQQQQQPEPAAPLAPALASMVAERRYDDGRVERVHASGLRVQEFPNGSCKHTWPDGRTATAFANGDLKKAWPDGRVEYWYQAVGCWHVTHPHGVEVFYFPSGQVEAHHPRGVKEIVFPDGGLRKVLPDGQELALTPQHLSREIQAPPPDSSLGA